MVRFSLSTPGGPPGWPGIPGMPRACHGHARGLARHTADATGHAGGRAAGPAGGPAFQARPAGPPYPRAEPTWSDSMTRGKPRL